MLNKVTNRRQAIHNIQDVSFVSCPYCEHSKEYQMLHWKHLKDSHNKTIYDVRNEFPDIPTMTLQESRRRSKARIKCDNKITRTCEKKYGGIGYASKVLEKKVRKSMTKIYGVGNPMQNKKVSSKFNGDGNPMRNPETAKKVSNTLTGRPSPLKGKTYEEILGPERATERLEELRISGALGQSLTPFISEPQKQLFEMVKEVYPTAVMEYPIFGYCIDIAVPELKLAFEYDGSYWHDAEKDKMRDEILEQLGWKTVRFVDHLPTKLLTTIQND